MSVLYTCAAEGCGVSFCRNMAMGERLRGALHVQHVTDGRCLCESDDGGWVHTVAACCEATAMRESGNDDSVALGWVQFLSHCAEHGCGWEASF